MLSLGSYPTPQEAARSFLRWLLIVLITHLVLCLRVYATAFCRYWGRDALEEASYERGTKRQPQVLPRMLFSELARLYKGKATQHSSQTVENREAPHAWMSRWYGQIVQQCVEMGGGV